MPTGKRDGQTVITCADCRRPIGEHERRHERSPGRFVCLPCHRGALGRHLALIHRRLSAITRYERTRPRPGLWAQSTGHRDVVHLVEREAERSLCGTPKSPSGWTQPGDFTLLCPGCAAIAFGILRAAG